MQSITERLGNLTLDPIVLVQKLWRGYRVRSRNLPIVLQVVRRYLISCNVNTSDTFDDGRCNSIVDEQNIIRKLQDKFEERMVVPRARMWYDILLLDIVYGWIPVNIKTTTTVNSDNTGNLAMCVYSYTNEPLDLSQFYTNGKMHKLLVHKLKEKQFNTSYVKDYFFLVLNKHDNSEIIINSIRGLTKLTTNVNNPPFQVKWSANRKYLYKSIVASINQFKACIKKSKPSWKEQFVSDMKLLD